MRGSFLFKFKFESWLWPGLPLTGCAQTSVPFGSRATSRSPPQYVGAHCGVIRIKGYSKGGSCGAVNLPTVVEHARVASVPSNVPSTPHATVKPVAALVGA